MPGVATLRALLRSTLLARARRYFNFFPRLLPVANFEALELNLSTSVVRHHREPVDI